MLQLTLVAAVFGLLPSARAHSSIWHPSMWGFNVTDSTFSYDNRPLVPLMHMPFSQWWFHGHLDYPPHAEDVYHLVAGQPNTFQIACDKGATDFYASADGGDIRDGDNVCPNSPMSAYHTTGIDDTKGCALAIAYKSDVSQVQPEDFAVFSVNHTCVWSRFTDFQVPSRLPACPDGGCICAWFWVHSVDSGSEQIYMNGFQCDVTGATSNVAVSAPQVPRRCGADPDNGKPDADLGNCTYGAKQPFYWYQNERNNLFEDQYTPPYYNDLYHFTDGAQDDIFEDSYVQPVPEPSPGAQVPTVNGDVGSGSAPSSSAVESSSSGYSDPAPASSSYADSDPAPTTSTYEVQSTFSTSSSSEYSSSSSSYSSSSDPVPSTSDATTALPTITALPTTITYEPTTITLSPSAFSNVQTCKPRPTSSALSRRKSRSRLSSHKKMKSRASLWQDIEI